MPIAKCDKCGRVYNAIPITAAQELAKNCICKLEPKPIPEPVKIETIQPVVEKVVIKETFAKPEREAIQPIVKTSLKDKIKKVIKRRKK